VKKNLVPYILSLLTIFDMSKFTLILTKNVSMFRFTLFLT